MNKIIKQSLAAAVLSIAAISAQAANVDVSISIAQPGAYGVIDIGTVPQPRVIYPQPVIIQRPAAVQYEPLYLYVPPEHSRHWERYCGQYHACGRPVYFVDDHWYHETYEPRYREHYEHEHGRDWHHDRDHDRGHEWHHDHDHDRD